MISGKSITTKNSGKTYWLMRYRRFRSRPISSETMITPAKPPIMYCSAMYDPALARPFSYARAFNRIQTS